MEEHLKCAVCFELLRDPVTLLPCLHTFCRVCHNRCRASQERSHTPRTCPCCRAPTQCAKANFQLANLVATVLAVHPELAPTSDGSSFGTAIPVTSSQRTSAASGNFLPAPQQSADEEMATESEQESELDGSEQEAAESSTDDSASETVVSRGTCVKCSSSSGEACPRYSSHVICGECEYNLVPAWNTDVLTANTCDLCAHPMCGQACGTVRPAGDYSVDQTVLAKLNPAESALCMEYLQEHDTEPLTTLLHAKLSDLAEGTIVFGRMSERSYRRADTVEGGAPVVLHISPETLICRSCSNRCL